MCGVPFLQGPYKIVSLRGMFNLKAGMSFCACRSLHLFTDVYLNIYFPSVIHAGRVDPLPLPLPRLVAGGISRTPLPPPAAAFDRADDSRLLSA